MKALCVSNAEITGYLPLDAHRELQSTHGNPGAIPLTMIFLNTTVPNVNLCNQNEKSSENFKMKSVL